MNRELMQLALDALRMVRSDGDCLQVRTMHAVKSVIGPLSAALAAPVAPQKERQDFIDGYMAGMGDGRRIAESENGPACCGENCGSKNPRHHSAECFAEHERTISQSRQPPAPVAPAEPTDEQIIHAIWPSNHHLRFPHERDYAIKTARTVLALRLAAPVAPAAGILPADCLWSRQGADMTLSQCIDKLAEKHGSLRAAARAAGLDVGYLSRLRSGEKYQPSDDVLAALGLERVVSYRLAKRAANPIERTSDAAIQYHMGEDCEAPT